MISKNLNDFRTRHLLARGMQLNRWRPLGPIYFHGCLPVRADIGRESAQGERL